MNPRFPMIAVALAGLATPAWAFTYSQVQLNACRDNTTGDVRVIDPLTEKCTASETAGTLVAGKYKTPAAEAWGNNDWGGRLFRASGTLRGVRYLSAGKYGESVSGLKDLKSPAFARMDLDDDGIDDFLFHDTSAGLLRVFYDFDDATPSSKADANITVNSGITWEVSEDEDGLDILTVCLGLACTDLSAVDRGGEPTKLP